MAPHTRDKKETGEHYAVLTNLLETAMVILGFVWTGLLIVELTYGLSPFLSAAFNAIWAIFAVDFTARFALAADKIRYLRANWLTGISLVIPAIRALRVVRLFRAASVVRGISLARLITAFNRSAHALGETMRRRGFGYVVALTLVVVVSGAAGMYAFEKSTLGQPGFGTYGDALWWTAMIITTLGSQYWPVTTAGRILCLLLSIYAFTVFGYIAAVLASHFVGREVLQKPDSPSRQQLQALQAEVAALREELRTRQTHTQERRSDVDQVHPD